MYPRLGRDRQERRGGKSACSLSYSGSREVPLPLRSREVASNPGLDFCARRRSTLRRQRRGTQVKLPGSVNLATDPTSLRKSSSLLPERGEGRMEDLVGHQFRREQPLENESFSQYVYDAY